MSELKRKRQITKRFGEKAIAGRDYSDDELSACDSSSIDGNYTPTKKTKYGRYVLSDDDDDDDHDNDSGESIGFGVSINYDKDMDDIVANESSIISNTAKICSPSDHIHLIQLLTKVMSSICKMDAKVDQIYARVSVIENKLIDGHAKKSCDSTLIKDDDESRKRKMYFKANCIPFTNIDDMQRFEENLDDSDFRKQSVSINHVKLKPLVKNFQFKHSSLNINNTETILYKYISHTG